MSSALAREVEHRTLRHLETLPRGGHPGNPSPWLPPPAAATATATCFRAWPGPAAKAARLLAGQANAARGRDVLWIIGADPGQGRGQGGGNDVPGAVRARFEEWLAGLRPFFNGLMPRVTAWEVPVDGGSGARRARTVSVVALHIETGRAPFVVVRRGGGGGEGRGLDVPWSDPGESSDPSRPAAAAAALVPRSATRMELIKLLSPLAALPRFEVLEAELHFYKNLHASPAMRGATPTFRWSLDACVYVLPGDIGHNAENGGGGSRVVLPRHRCHGAVELPSAAVATTAAAAIPPAGGDHTNGAHAPVVAVIPTPPTLPPPLHAVAAEFSVTADQGSPGVRVTDSAVLVDGLGRFFVYLCGSTRHPGPAWGEAATLQLEFGPAGAERVAVAEARLRPEPVTEANQAGRWKL